MKVSDQIQQALVLAMLAEQYKQQSIDAQTLSVEYTTKYKAILSEIVSETAPTNTPQNQVLNPAYNPEYINQNNISLGAVGLGPNARATLDYSLNQPGKPNV